MTTETTAKTETKHDKKEKDLTIDPRVQAVSDEFVEKLSTDEATGVATISAATYNDILRREGVDPAVADKIEEIKSIVMAGGMHAAGRVALPVFEKNPEVNTVSFELPASGRSFFSFTADRSGKVPDGPGKTRPVYGVLGGKFMQQPVSELRDQVGNVKKLIGRMAADRLAPKS